MPRALIIGMDLLTLNFYSSGASCTVYLDGVNNEYTTGLFLMLFKHVCCVGLTTHLEFEV